MYKKMLYRGGSVLTSVVLTFILSVNLVICGMGESAYADTGQPIDIIDDFEGAEETSVLEPNRASYGQSNPTNLLLDNGGNSKEFITYRGNEYELTSVEITRYRQKVIIEYYVGDMNESTFVGADEGYADYLDSIGEYVMSLPQINARFGTSFSSSDYSLTAHPQTQISPQSTVKEYAGTDDPVRAKVLIGKIASPTKYSLRASGYQNKQDVSNPDPVGLLRSSMEANTTPFWRVSSLSGSSHNSVVVGEVLDLRAYFKQSSSASYPSGNRTGSLTKMGYFDNNNKFVTLSDPWLVVTEATPNIIYLASIYEVADLGGTVEAPKSVGSGLISSIQITFVSNGLAWKEASTSETLYPTNASDAAKLAAYPFDAEGDIFDNPDFIFGEDDSAFWTAGWMLGHHMRITYSYAPISPQASHTVTFLDWDSRVIDVQVVNSGGAAIAPTNPSRAGHTFVGWDTDFSNVTHDLTVVAQYEPKEQIDPGSDPQTDPADPRVDPPIIEDSESTAITEPSLLKSMSKSAQSALASTDDSLRKVISAFALLVVLGTVAIGVVFYRKRRV